MWRKSFFYCVCQKIRHLIYLWSDVVTTLILFWFLFLVNFDFICQLDITSINITLIKDLAFIQKFSSSDSLLIFFSFSGFYNICIIYTYTYTFTYTYTHIYIYTYTYTHTHIHIHIHIYIYWCNMVLRMLHKKGCNFWSVRWIGLKFWQELHSPKSKLTYFPARSDRRI